MGVFVEKDYRVKRKSSENGRKSAFAHKVKNGGENYKKNVREKRHCCKVSDEAAFCLIQRPYISKTLLT
ncbi:hypothetical protein OSL05_22515, partial [Escherichia coli]|nr:hypothetical protein [Escherichia coli]